MQPDPARVAETRDWLARAMLDLRAANHVLVAVPPLSGSAVFHSQQLAEKSLKGFLAWHDVAFRKTHDLVEIGRQCSSIDPTLSDLVGRIAILSQYASEYRYPGGPLEPPVAEAQAALALAREVYEAILSRLPVEVRP